MCLPRPCRLTIGYEGKKLALVDTGVEYSDYLEKLTGKLTMKCEGGFLKIVLCGLIIDDARIYAYVRFETGDEMSRRAKFAFITWIGPAVPPLKKAKVSTDKAFVKAIINVSVYILGRL